MNCLPKVEFWGNISGHEKRHYLAPNPILLLKIFSEKRQGFSWMTILCFCLFKGEVTLPGVIMALSTPRCAPKTQNNPNADPSPFSCIQSCHFFHDSSQKRESHHPDLFAFGQLPTGQNMVQLNPPFLGHLLFYHLFFCMHTWSYFMKGDSTWTAILFCSTSSSVISLP